MGQHNFGFSEVARAIHEERRRLLHVHCTLKELDAYRQNALPTDKQKKVVEHLSACDDCTTLLLYAITDGIGQRDNGADSKSLESEIEEDWNRLRRHLDSGARSGKPLVGLLAGGRLPVQEALPLALRIARAVAELHSRGQVLHDLRAENVLITSTGKVAIPDLGVAPTTESFEVGYGGSAEAAVVNVYRSISPEQVAAERLDIRSNLFSLGVLFYEVFTGFSPFRHSTPLSTASRILSLDPIPAIDINPKIAPRLARLIDRLLAKDPNERPSSAAAVARELQAIATDLRISTAVSREDSADIEEEIEHLYDKILDLSSAQAADGSSRDEEIENAYTRLRVLQENEAERFRQRFETSLNMPIDAGQRILARAQSLRKELEDITFSDAAPEDTDDPQASSESL